MPSLRETLRPRLCVLDKGENGYGFHLHGEKGKTGQFIRLVEPDSPAERSGLRAGDRLMFVNGENVESESHQQVVSRIRASTGSLELVVVDTDTEQLLKKHELKCRREFVTEGVPLTDTELQEEVNGREPTTEPVKNGGMDHSALEKKLSSEDSEKNLKNKLRPRLCVIQKGSGGYGFNLHSEKTRPGQYIRAVDEDSPAERAGLLPKDRIVEVNGVSVEGKLHTDVVNAIKAGGDKTELLVVDPDTDAFFNKCGVAPRAKHLTGPLPEPLINGDMEEKINGKGDKEVELKETKVSVSPSPSNASSNTSLSTTPTISPTSEAVEASIADAIPALNLTLQQVKERAHQKRSNKRAPPMDWNKKHELFSKM
ncbi:Na(+)/H(+) exchange regulatory cofactor NHE-RF1 [Hoplias malabaricus]|uniref:Na(+)/H(+) exchange regulatory cofactor NHE-RF1 n=1 Tax=Hoplias malabaricus TaxID=27720 RepID=UPI003462C6F9